MKRLTKTLNVEFEGALLRLHAFILKEKQGESLAIEILNTAKMAGQQLISVGKINSEILEIIKQPLISLEKLYERNEKAHRKACEC